MTLQFWIGVSYAGYISIIFHMGSFAPHLRLTSRSPRVLPYVLLLMLSASLTRSVHSCIVRFFDVPATLLCITARLISYLASYPYYSFIVSTECRLMLSFPRVAQKKVSRRSGSRESVRVGGQCTLPRDVHTDESSATRAMCRRLAECMKPLLNSPPCLAQSSLKFVPRSRHSLTYLSTLPP